MILVTGGTGLVGTHLLYQLTQRGHTIRALYRNGSHLERVKTIFSYYTDAPDQLFKKIEWVLGDITDIPSLEKAFENVTQVYHCAALISFDPNDYQKLKSINKKGTANVVNLCVAHKIEKLCYTSSIATIGSSLDRSATVEGKDWNEAPATVYALTKYGAEMEAWRGAYEGVPTIIVNPGVIIGPGFWTQGKGGLFHTAKRGLRFYPPGGTGFVDVRDVVTGMVGLMEKDIANERYIVVGENLSFQEILGKMALALGKKPPTKKLAFWQLNIGRFFDFMGHIFTRKGRTITKDTIHMLRHRDIYDATKIKTELGLEFTPMDETVAFSCSLFSNEFA
ncbi:MAG: NAD-dependent epimerase/dehydratase family protein [Flavobacteriaceae bacterium]